MTRHFKKGVVGGIGEKSLQKENSHGKTKPNAALGSRKGGTPIGYSGRTALRREQCDM
jgi:hypothetical protein